MEKWIADVVGKMHVNKIRQSELADALGFTRGYVCMVLNEKHKPKNAQKAFEAAVDALIAEKKTEKEC